MQDLVFKKLTSLDIVYTTYYHDPFFTCEQALQAKETIPGAQCKNLFLKDDKKRLYLVVTLAESIINLKNLSQFLHASGLRFADGVLLQQYLGVQAGSVTPFGLIFDTDHKVNVVLDHALFNYSKVGFHPLENNATTVIIPQDLITFLNSCGNRYRTVDFSAL